MLRIDRTSADFCRAGNTEASRIPGTLQYRSLDWRDV